MDQDQGQRRPGWSVRCPATGRAPMKTMPAVVRVHGGGKPGAELIVYPGPHLALGAGMGLSPPGPGRRQDDQDQEQGEEPAESEAAKV